MGWKRVEQRSNGDSWIFECEDCKATVEFAEEAILLRGHIVEERERGIEVGEDDDQIFFYFESESEIKEFMKEGKNEFIILEYSSFDKS